MRPAVVPTPQGQLCRIAVVERPGTLIGADLSRNRSSVGRHPRINERACPKSLIRTTIRSNDRPTRRHRSPDLTNRSATIGTPRARINTAGEADDTARDHRSSKPNTVPGIRRSPAPHARGIATRIAPTYGGPHGRPEGGTRTHLLGPLPSGRPRRRPRCTLAVIGRDPSRRSRAAKEPLMFRPARRVHVRSDRSLSRRPSGVCRSSDRG